MIKIKKAFTIIFLMNSLCGISQNYDTYFVGHSLIGHTIPVMLNQMANESGLNYSSSRQIINGSPLKYNWENPHLGEIGNYQIDLATGNYNTLVLTEAVPLKNHLTWSDTYNISNNFYNYFNNYASSGVVYIYETWHCINSGTAQGCDYDNESHINWRQRLDEDLDEWESIATHLNDLHAESEVLIVPGGQALARLYDAVENNEIEGVDSINYFFLDDIHLNDIGSYYMACVMYATLFKQSPVGTIINTTDSWGGPYVSPGETLGLKLQQLAWEEVCSYPRSGVDCSVLNISDNWEKPILRLTSFNNEIALKIENDVIISIDIYDVRGRNVISQKTGNVSQYTFKANGLNADFYILKARTLSGKIITEKVIFAR